MGDVTDVPRAWLESVPDPDGRLVLRIGGELDLDSVPGVEAGVDRLLDRHPGAPVTVDLTELAFLDSSGVAVLIRIANVAGSVRIRRANAVVRRVIEVLGLAQPLGLDAA